MTFNGQLKIPLAENGMDKYATENRHSFNKFYLPANFNLQHRN